MILATWNVNSVRSRLERLTAWLDKHQPDVLCLQELKATDDAFPLEPLAKAGYHAAVFGQKTYNGVAILCRAEPRDVRRGLDDGQDDPQARLISARLGKIVVLCAYVPNGGQVGSDAFQYKLTWLKRLRTHLETHYCPDEPLALCGDTNVAIDDLDVDRPDEWAGTVLCHRAVRAGLQDVIAWGLTDVFRAKHPEGHIYSFWDYRNLDFPLNNGLRLDHILATSALAAQCRSARIDRDERKGPKPSDHAPVIAVFAD